MAMTIDDLHRPAVRCIPSGDAAFAEAAKRALAGVPAEGTERDVAAHLQGVLRRAYPRVVVVPMNPLASAWGERTWYVYRDGH